jgi:hypothetical protein
MNHNVVDCNRVATIKRPKYSISTIFKFFLLLSLFFFIFININIQFKIANERLQNTSNHVNSPAKTQFIAQNIK